MTKTNYSIDSDFSPYPVYDVQDLIKVVISYETNDESLQQNLGVSAGNHVKTLIKKKAMFCRWFLF